MNWIKNIFIISVLNFSIVGGMVFYKLGTTVAEPKGESIVTPTPSPLPSPTSIPNLISKDKEQPSTSSPTPTKSAVVTEKPKATPTTDPLAGKCIIFVSGTRYDITQFRSIHGGGDVFQCGTDMTDNFKSQHPDSYLAQMAKYKI